MRRHEHGRSVHEVIPAYLWRKGDSHFSSYFIFHHLELNNQSTKPAVARLSYIFHDSSISCGPRMQHILLLTNLEIENTY